ncbi:ABC-F family ATP-binding cassette domain-containing protein, partial [Candidatus Uhrbacteria bacterium]|nr:ABC-F family ATP-binding cassette domain-containing protein [Candidatus Uhrbacteria bacterium]
KSTLLRAIAERTRDTCRVASEAVVGYYKQDFGNLDFTQTAFDTLRAVMMPYDEHILRSTAAGFLLDGKLLANPIRALSEGQKGLLSFCRLVLLKPGLLLLDEPTNHINFRHLPIIAHALDAYEGALIMVSHIPDFVAQIRIDEAIDLTALR